MTSSPPAATAHPRDAHRRAFLLHQLATAPDGKRTQADANKRIPKQFQDELALPPADANDLRATMAGQGLLEVVTGRGVAYAITEAGRAWLREHEAFVPLAAAKGQVNPPADPVVHESRVAWLLLQLLGLPSDGATASSLNKTAGPSRLDLNAATARQVRGELVVRGLIAVARTSRSERYALTADGLSHLTTLSFDKLGVLKLPGPALTALVAAARTGPMPPAGATTRPSSANLPPAQLESAVMAIFDELLRERYANIRMVPIHEVRAAILGRYGAAAASHAVFDERLMSLRAERKVRLVPISDPSRATAEQLQSSIPAPVGTLFYIEKAHDAHAV